MTVCPNPKCGKALPKEAKFCPSCGSSVEVLKEGEEKDPLIGRVVGERYRLLEMIAEGGMALVYRAEHILLEDPCAVKIIKRDLATQKEMLKRFQREAKLTRKVAKLSPHIISIYDFGEEEDIGFFYVMELLNGYPFTELLEDPNNPPPQKKVVKFIAQIAQALQVVHNEGLIHRDIKPDNIFIHRDPSTGEEMVKLLDFGIARDRNQKGTMLTNFGRVMGTPEYMSPEQCRGPTQEQYKRGESHLDGRSDVYSLGVLLYQCLTGRVPFPLDDSGSPMAIHRVMKGHVMERPVPPIEARPDLNILPALSAITMRALEKKPEDRFQSMLEFRDALLSCLPDLERLESGAGSGASEDMIATVPLDDDGDRAGLLSTLEPEDIESELKVKLKVEVDGGGGVSPSYSGGENAIVENYSANVAALEQTYPENAEVLDKTALDVQLPEAILKEAQQYEKATIGAGYNNGSTGEGSSFSNGSDSSVPDIEKTIPSPIPIEDLRKLMEEKQRKEEKEADSSELSETEPTSIPTQNGGDEDREKGGSRRWMLILLAIILIFGTGVILILPKVLSQD